MKLTEIVSKDPIRALVYGVSGSGKSTLFGLMACEESLRPLYVADWDLRIASLRARVPSEVWQYIEAEPYRDGKIQGEAITRLIAKLERLESEGFKSFACDSLTFASRGIMARVLMLGGQQATSTPQLQHYMQAMSITEDFVSRACSKSFNVFMTCHEDTTRDEISGRLFKSIDMTGKLVNRIPGYFNELWHCEVAQQTGKEPEYSVRTRSDLTYGARTSFSTLKAVEPQEEIWRKIVDERSPKP